MLGLTGTSLVGSDFELATGQRTDAITRATPNGWIAGTTLTNVRTGNAAWVTNVNTDGAPLEFRQVGLLSADYRGTGGAALDRMFTTVSGLTGTHATGTSISFLDSTATNGKGTDAWVTNLNTEVTHRVGLFINDANNRFIVDTGTTAQIGSRTNTINGITASGWVLGRSNRYVGPTTSSPIAWVANADTGVTTRLGFFDAEHTQGNATENVINLNQQSTATIITEGGLVGGTSTNWVNTATGSSAWVANANTGAIVRVGLTDAAHTQFSGIQSSSISAVSDVGNRAIGTSIQAVGTPGQTAWVANTVTGETTHILNPTAGNLTSTDGYSSSGLYVGQTRLDLGLVAGASRTYDGNTIIGNRDWVANLNGTGTPTIVGLYDGPHSHSTGRNNSAIVNVLANGSVVGTASRYRDEPANFTTHGTSIWVANSSGLTTQIGLYDATHTRADGFISNQFALSGQHSTDSGLVAGWADRFDSNGQEIGRTAWVFDLNSSGLVRFDVSVSAADSEFPGQSFSQIQRIYENGFVLGFYTDQSSLVYSEIAFVWSAATGRIDINGLASEDDLFGAGLSALQRPTDLLFENGRIFMVGDGTPLTSGGAPYVMDITHAIPEPSTYALIGIGLAFGLFMYFRRRKVVADVRA